ncbi:uncharacterized protein RAG0_11938 [Rhynchosporium agropyri]|uniref:Uncharacterized protein n=1 Tax=Rhynchosporium agropyri TaxID=914238 RepID=A0A1E1L694_9HELO|nr:uncharacterized protein RAG0_11938 [Rhynchosporium agropyri]
MVGRNVSAPNLRELGMSVFASKLSKFAPSSSKIEPISLAQMQDFANLFALLIGDYTVLLIEFGKEEDIRISKLYKLCGLGSSHRLLRGQSNAMKLAQTFKNLKEEYTQDRKWVNEKDHLKDRAEILDLNEQLKSLGGNVQQLKDELEGPGTYVYKRSEKDFKFLED